MGIGHVRPQTQRDVFHHRIEDDLRADIPAEKLSEFFVIAPVEEAQHHDQQQFLTKHGKKRRQRGSRPAHMRLKPDDQRVLPAKREGISHFVFLLRSPHEDPFALF